MEILAQDTTAHHLEEVTVQAFAQNRRGQTAAAVHVLNRPQLDRFPSVSPVNAINTIPGVRMEERSPGSYRINIRGSALRSPFGVRNVKIYYNDIPFTDPAGTSFLNGLGMYNFRSVEVIKGPGSSMYGAGTGGVMLLQGGNFDTSAAWLGDISIGSFGLFQFYSGFNLGTDFKHAGSVQRISSDGYRDHSALQRNVFNYTGTLQRSRQRWLRLSVLYSETQYQTPGGLTLEEFNANPAASRPAAGIFPSASAARAAIDQQNFLAGITYHESITPRVSHTTTLYYAHNQLRNPAIRNYGTTKEPHLGGRSHINYRSSNQRLQLDGGLEIQQNFHRLTIYTNQSGSRGTLQSDDRVYTMQWFVFAQASFSLNGWIATAGGSINQMGVRFRNLYPDASREQLDFSNGIAPRFSLLRKFNNMSVYAAVERGFSPPAAAELLPTGSPLNLSLRAEAGWNRQFGIRGMVHRRWYVDVNAFWFRTDNTIVLRRDAGGGEYFENGGATRQRGVEAFTAWHVYRNDAKRRAVTLWSSYALHLLQYASFRQLNNDYSGNRMPGNAKHNLAAGLDITTAKGWMLNGAWFFVDRMFLNDANTAAAPAYHLVTIKGGYAFRWKQQTLQVFAGVDNLLNETYSLGNDINAAGGRFYNAAPARNFFLQLRAALPKS